MNERDPHGKDPHEGGAKLDHGKNRLGLVLGGFPRALEAVGQVGTYGANKYSDNGWMEVPNGQQRYADAMLRHILKDFTGERVDPESGLLHAAHAAWNALAVLELELRRLEPTKDLSRDELLAELRKNANLFHSKSCGFEVDIAKWANITKD